MGWPKFTLDAEQKDIKEVLQDKIKKIWTDHTPRDRMAKLNEVIEKMKKFFMEEKSLQVNKN